MPTLILRIVLVLKIESLIYVYFCPSTYVLIMGEFGMKDLDRVEEVLLSLISCTRGLSAFGLRNLKEGKNIKVSAMKLLFNLLRLIHIVLPSSRQPN